MRNQAAAILGVAFLVAWSIRASATESVCYGTPSKGALENGVQIPESGPNFSPYSFLGVALGRTYVHSKVAAVIEAAYASLAVSDPAKKHVYGESGWPAGGQIRPHRTHQNGTAVDFMVPVVDATGRSVPFPPAYSTSSVMASSSIRMLGTRLWPSTSRRSPTIFMPFTKPRSSTASASPG